MESMPIRVHRDVYDWITGVARSTKIPVIDLADNAIKLYLKKMAPALKRAKQNSALLQVDDTAIKTALKQ